MSDRLRHFRLPILCAAFCVGASHARAADEDLVQFEREVRPILAEHCFECHGPDKQKGGLRLDQKSGMLNGGDSEQPAVVAGKAGESQLIKRASSSDPEEAMPPKGSRLTPEQIARLKRWIDNGAHWPETKDLVA